ncbi:uncharacterized protein C18orf19 homolog A [Anopheles moucheti]|uniref:uncharacterized protein C18orf19 homolog A n=1 Tax=Anopheles moucheti TaxID=186751 RepID=UPI0022EFDEA2|nr:uncharacterized protein C18orf19 homolog A [Anopheles moucheti]XP_052888626.1 uncharacterized protein C18orf19 homolog A [Anopheles moucheti]XP_052888627.1 uncharacterized protein C18orf19 homolog A [Anopheles moucheti]
MAALALGMVRLTSLGQSSSVKLLSVAPRLYTSGNGFNRYVYSTLSTSCLYNRGRYATISQPVPTWYTSVSLRCFTQGDALRRLQKPTNEQQQESDEPTPASTPVPEKLGLFARFKKMYKEYWYVLVPVHCLTSVMWFGGFYYASTSGVDVIAILESLGVSETLINPVRDSSLGHIAVAYLLYKIATPARYTVTLGGTTISIKYLEQWGYIKPMPSKARLVQMYKDKKENIQDKIAEKKQDFKDRKQLLTEKKNNLMSDLNIKDKDGKAAATTATTTSSVTDNK